MGEEVAGSLIHDTGVGSASSPIRIGNRFSDMQALSLLNN
jgi:hypothetical protein